MNTTCAPSTYGLPMTVAFLDPTNRTLSQMVKSMIMKKVKNVKREIVKVKKMKNEKIEDDVMKVGVPK